MRYLQLYNFTSFFRSYTGATYIKEMLMENKKLQHLDIADNKIGNDGVSHITEGLQQNYTLTKLMLYNCEISAKGNCSYNYYICNMAIASNVWHLH